MCRGRSWWTSCPISLTLPRSVVRGRRRERPPSPRPKPEGGNMRRRASIGALLLIGVGVVLGGTVLRDQVASARSLAQSVIVSNTSANPVPVTAASTLPVHEQGTVAVQSGNEEVSITKSYSDPSGFCGGDLYTVPTGKSLVIEYVAGEAGVGSSSESAVGQIDT